MWNERYRQTDYFYGTAPNDFLAEHVGVLPKGRILCLAEGEGRNAVFLAEQGYDVVAVDGSEMGREKALQLAESRGVSIAYHVCDLAEFELGTEAWAGVVSIFAHVPPHTRRKIHQNMARALKPEGVFLLEAYAPPQLQNSTGGPKNVELLMELTKIRAELDGMTEMIGQELERSVVEGRGHTGWACVTQWIGRKK